MNDCGCGPTAADTSAQRRTLRIALVLNGLMFVVGVTAGLLADSSGLLADGLDMLADASAYAIALAAAQRTSRFKRGAATLSGGILLLLGLAVLADAVRRLLFGAEPEGGLMIGVAAVALVVNATVLRMLAAHRDEGVHLRATWIFTRADVVANIAVILSGVAVLLTGNHHIDAIVGAAIGLYVIKEAFEILRDAQAARRA